MKKDYYITILLTVGLMHAQAFKGKGDVKFDVLTFKKEDLEFVLDLDLEKTCHWICYSYLLSVSNDDLEINQNLMTY
jgi:hypothetical protein